MTESTVYIATSNAGKLRDFAAAAKLNSVEVLPLPGFSEMPSVAEDGATFEANARKKAEHYSRLFPGNLVLGDDSGLEVRALGGAPGVHSARFAAEDASVSGNAPDEANNRKLLSLLASSNDRAARFVQGAAVFDFIKGFRAAVVSAGDLRLNYRQRANSGIIDDCIVVVQIHARAGGD